MADAQAPRGPLDVENGGDETEESRLLPPGAMAGGDGPVQVLEIGPPRTPLWPYFVLVLSIFAMTAAPIVFTIIEEVPVLTVATWRLTVCAWVQMVLASVQVSALPREERHGILRECVLLIPGGALIMLHFWMWLTSLRLTSMTHSLLLVSMTPVFFALGSLIARLPISGGELGGTALGIAGCAFLAWSSASHTGGVSSGLSPTPASHGLGAVHPQHRASAVGDLLSFGSSGCFAVYLIIGSRLRKWMPLFVYTSGINASAAFFMALASMGIDGTSLTGHGTAGVFGFLFVPRYLLWICVLAIVPGTIGHSGVAAVLLHLPPLTVTLALNIEPLVAAFVGYSFGMVPIPSLRTLLGGTLVLAAVAWSSVARNSRLKAERAAAAAKAATAGAGDLSMAPLGGPVRLPAPGSPSFLESPSIPRVLSSDSLGSQPSLSHKASGPALYGRTPSSEAVGLGGDASRDLGSRRHQSQGDARRVPPNRIGASFGGLGPSPSPPRSTPTDLARADGWLRTSQAPPPSTGSVASPFGAPSPWLADAPGPTTLELAPVPGAGGREPG